MRSFLFVPADSERKLAKGPASRPDALILDLEDSVASDRKQVAREMAVAYLKAANRAGPKLYVRVNALDTGLTLGDLAVVMQGKPDGVVFPKCVGQANLDLLATYLDALEVREGTVPGTTRILTIATESAAAVLALGLLAGCASHGPGTAAKSAPKDAVVTVAPGPHGHRFDMQQNGRKMTAEEFDAWMKARGIRVAKGAPTRPKASTTARRAR